MNKRFYLVIFINLFTVWGFYAQTVTIKELISKTKCRDFSCFNDLITNRGFSFNASGKHDETTSWYRFSSDKAFVATSNPGVTSHNQSIVSFGKNTSVGFGTSYKPHYKALMDELAALKFKSSPAIDEGEGSIAVVYSSAVYPKITITLRTILITKPGLGSWTYYDFQVSG